MSTKILKVIDVYYCRVNTLVTQIVFLVLGLLIIASIIFHLSGLLIDNIITMACNEITAGWVRKAEINQKRRHCNVTARMSGE
jgi:hypothetical protein